MFSLNILQRRIFLSCVANENENIFYELCCTNYLDQMLGRELEEIDHTDKSH